MRLQCLVCKRQFEPSERFVTLTAQVKYENGIGQGVSLPICNKHLSEKVTDALLLNASSWSNYTHQAYAEHIFIKSLAISHIKMNKLTRTLNEYMRDKHLSQKALAQLLEVSPGAISRWLKEERVPDKNSLHKMFKIPELQVAVLEYLKGNSNDQETI